jgi:hypothetical protein
MSGFLYWHFESVNDPHIHRLQTACAICGKNITLIFIFQSSGISWVCSPMVNEEQEFSVLCPVWCSNCTRTSSKVVQVTHVSEFAVYLVFFINLHF